MKNYAIILASGTGSRIGLNIPKQFYKLKNKTILEYSIEIFEKNGFIWGGKWDLWDNMHFEYRPELILLQNLLKGKEQAKK